MADLLLQTKLYAPPARPNVVPRPHLIQILEEGVQKGRRLSLVSAPAGFGKTTLVTNWLAVQGRSAAWLSLDERDNDLPRFLGYLMGAVRTVHANFAPGLAPALTSVQAPDIDSKIDALLNAFFALSEPLLITLDDYHILQEPEIHRTLAKLIDYLPAEIHIILTSREDPPLPLPRWRARDAVTDVHARDLRFDLEETTAFLHQTMGLSLEKSGVKALEERTEGWVAGLQLAALSLRDEQDPTAQIGMFSGSDRLVADYLLSEALANQPAEVERFLLVTSILERFCAPLCDDLLEIGNSQEILEMLERTNLFVVSLDNQRSWYRYHHLFAQLLSHRLRRDASERQIASLHQRASRWFSESDKVVDAAASAVRHSLQAGDKTGASRLIAMLPSHVIFEQGGAGLLKQWASALTPTDLQAHPRSAILIAAAYMITGDVAFVWDYLALVEDDPRVRGETSLLQAILTRNAGDSKTGLAQARQALAHIPETDVTFYATARTQVVANYLALGMIPEAEQALLETLDWLPTEGTDNLGMRLQVIHQLGSSRFIQGDLFRAEKRYRTGIVLAERAGDQAVAMSGLMHAGLGELYYEWNELDRAREAFDAALDWGQHTGITDILLEAYVGQLDLASVRRDRATVGQYLELLHRFVHKSRLREIIERGDAIAARYHLRVGELAQASHWANASIRKLTDTPDFSEIGIYRTLAAIRLAEWRASGDYRLMPGLLNLLTLMIDMSRRLGHIRGLILSLNSKALIQDLLGESAGSLETLSASLALAYPGSHMRIYLDEGPPMFTLINQVESANPPYVRQLSQAFTDEALTIGQDSLDAPAVRLTPREREILVEIVAGCSNKEIEARLFISKNTVRTHIKNLYSKLGVQSRTQAILRAREMGLLS